MSEKKSGATLVEMMIVGILLLLFAVGALGGFLLVRGCNYVCDNGVKNVAEKAWVGENSDQSGNQ